MRRVHAKEQNPFGIFTEHRMKQESSLPVETKKRLPLGRLARFRRVCFLTITCLLFLQFLRVYDVERIALWKERFITKMERLKSIEKQCSLQTDHVLKKSSARVVVLEKGGSFQLEIFMKHYSQVFQWEDIVVIDNMSKDPHTLNLLKAYSQKGVHVWKCDTNYQFVQSAMVTHVMRWAAPHSDFLFPVDVDELLGVRVTTNAHNVSQPIATANPALPTSVGWNQEVFRSAFGLLKTAEGKMIKMDYVAPIPTACQYDPDDKEILPRMSTSSHVLYNDWQQDFCNLKYATISHMGCFSKSFVMGKDFLHLEDGNHFIVTRQHPRSQMSDCFRDPVTYCQFAHSLVLVHIRDINFIDFVFQGLRGAAADGHIQKYPFDCYGGMRGIHTCKRWNDFGRVGFHPELLHQQFLADRCHDDEAYATLRVDALIRSSCER